MLDDWTDKDKEIEYILISMTRSNDSNHSNNNNNKSPTQVDTVM